MKFIINQSKLSNHISIVQKAVSSRSTLKILEGILLTVKDNKLKLTGTDSEIISIETFLDCQVVEEGSIVINSRIFGDVIRKLPNSDVYIEVNNNMVNIKCENSEFNIIGNDGNEYPQIPIFVEQKSINMPKDLLKNSIRQTSFAVSLDVNRKVLTGIYFELKQNVLSMVALDGYRLSRKKFPMKSDLEFEAIIPGKAMNELYKILDDGDEDIVVNIAESNISFETGSTIFYSQLIDGQYFSYEDILRNNHETTVITNRKELQNSIERASLLAKEEKANLIKFSIEDSKLTINSNTEIGNVHEELVTEKTGSDLSIAFNSKYILDGIKNMDSDNIKLHFLDNLNPCIIEGVEIDNYTYLVLPVRLAADE